MSGHAHRAVGDRLTQARQPRVRHCGQPPAGERLAHHPVAAATRGVAPAHELAPGSRLLSDPADTHAEQPGLPARIVQLVVGERRVAAFGELHRLAGPVGRPVVGNRRPVVLDIVTRLRQVAADAIGRFAPALARERRVQTAQGPVRLARVVLRVIASHRGVVRFGVACGDGAGRLHLAEQEAPEPAHQMVVAGVARDLPPVRQPGGQERRRAGCHSPRPAERGPVLVFDHVVERPFETPVGGARRPRQPGRRGLVEAHRRSGMANLVVLGRRRVVLRVVQVEPRAVGILVPDEPIDTGLRRVPQLGRCNGRAVLRRGRDRERRDQDQGQGQTGPQHPTADHRAGARRTPGRSRVGRANQAVSGSRLKTIPVAGGSAQPRAVPVHDLKRGAGWSCFDAEPGQPVERTDHRAQSPVPGACRIDANDAIARRRCRPDQEHRYAEKREDLHRRRRLDHHVEDDGHPHGRVAGAAQPQPDRDEQLGEHDELGRPGVEGPVGEQGDRPVWQRPRLQVVARPHDSLPAHGAAEPVGIHQLAQSRCAVDRRALEPQQPERPGRRPEVRHRLPPAAAKPRVH